MLLKNYIDDTRGQFAIMFSVAAMVITLGTAFAIDTAGMMKERTRLQDITDMATLAAAQTGEKKANGKMKKAVKKIFEANNSGREKITHDVKIVDGEIIITASTRYNAFLMDLFNAGKTTIGTNASAPISFETPFNISLVLDRTGSMSGANMASLKTAANALIDIVDTFESETKVAVVPFAQYVNVGLSNRHQKWMNVPDDSVTEGAEICKMKRDLISQSDCTTETRTYYSDGVERTYNRTTCATKEYGPEYEYCYIPKSTQKWYGCAGSRNNPWYKKVKYNNKPFPGIMNTRCGEQVLPLTSNMASVKNKINSLSTSGNTYIPAGLGWGWRMLDDDIPFAEPSNKEKTRKRILILMTDGANTLKINPPKHGRWIEWQEVDPNFDPDDVDALSEFELEDDKDDKDTNKLTRKICKKIKKDKVEIFSVAYKLEGGAGSTSATLKKCASGADNFYEADNAAELKKAFEDIGNNLFDIRLSG